MNLCANQLTFIQVLRLIVWAIVLWGLGVVILRWLGPRGYLSDSTTPLIYAAVVIGTLPFVYVTPWLLRIPRQHTLLATCIMAITATMLDGVVVRWYPWIYAADPALLAQCAATLLWGASALVAIGVALQCRVEKTCQPPASR